MHGNKTHLSIVASSEILNEMYRKHNPFGTERKFSISSVMTDLKTVGAAYRNDSNYVIYYFESEEDKNYFIMRYT